MRKSWISQSLDIRRFLQYLTNIPEGSVNHPPYVEHSRRVYILFSISIIGIVVIFLSGIIALIEKSYALGMLDFTLAFALAVNLLHARRHKDYNTNIYFGITLSAIFFVYIFLTGGINTTGFVCYYIFPLIASFLLGSKKGAIATVLISLPVVILFLMKTPPSILTNYSFDFKLRFLSSFLVVSVFSYLFEYSREQNQEELQSAHDDLEKRVDERTSALQEAIQSLQKEISERRRAEEALQESEERYRTILESIEDGYYEVDLEGNLTFLNDSMSRISATPKEQLIGMNTRQYTDQENAEKLFQAFNKVYRTGEPSRECTWEIIRRNGIKSHLEASISLRKDSSGKPIGFRGIVRDITERKQTEELLRESEAKFQQLFDEAPVGYHVYDTQGRITKVNHTELEMLGYTPEEVLGQPVWKFAGDEETSRHGVLAKIAGTIPPGHSFERVYRRKDGTTLTVIVEDRLLRDSEGRITGIRSTIQDITERKQTEELLRESEEKFRQLAENIREVFYISEQGITRYVSPAYMEIWGRSPQHLYEEPKSILDTVHPEDRDRVLRSLPMKNQGEVEEVYRIVRPDGSIRWIKDRSFPIYDDSGKTHRIVGIAADITDLKLGEEKLKYLSLHDSLTGLYNRIYFEEEISRIEKARHDTVGILSCDVDGLKLVNDTLGHDQGDRLLIAAAGVIRECFREGDLVARIGGDEFSVLLPDTTESAVENACQRIQEAVANYNATNPQLPLSISVGFAINDGGYRSLKDLFKEADNHMYQKKLYGTKSVRSTIVKTLINTLKARDRTAENHIIRLEKLLASIAAFIGLPDSTKSDLSLLAKFHDIGKVGIADSILSKEGTLTSEEWTEMKRHCEIGYRIALAAPELVPIADWILKHHECWNGQGYPFGIEGEEIPIECRLLTIADTYEALTSACPYRKTYSHREAVAELMSYSGKEFDPKLLEKFLQMLETKSLASALDVTAI
jgi:diguanylate cyclase (GGDEF)-like protein/PAS domain S-box-containing protein